ncbi:FtsX-like permease family protein [Halococcus sp. AFM35]|uniref:FtsX-like permease family protein n=1 Tax=Halococcus sp. AFM35 TaxID=3421653 RepID=UPI003EB82218
MPAEQSGYTRALLTRWSRRDRLTVLVVAVTTAFLVGSTLLLTAAGAQTATIAGELDTTTTVTHHNSFAAASANTTDEEITLPTATLMRPNGSTARFIGVPPNAPTQIADASVGWRRATIPSPNQTIRGPVTTTTRQRFRLSNGTTTTLEIQSHAANDSLFPSDWYVANASTVRTLGTQNTSAFVIHPGQNASGLLSVPQNGTPILSALVFLFAGMREMLIALLAATVGSALLIVVVVYNVLRMSVRDRLETIKIIRSTGGTPRRVLTLFGLRAGLIVTVGVALGFAIGVVVTNAVVNAATYIGLPISLTPELTPLALGILGVMLTVLVVAGVAAGTLAARSAATRSPARLTATAQPTSTNDRSRFARLRTALTPTLLDPRAIVPTTLTLAVFAVVVILVLSFAGAIAPLSSPGEATISEADAAHVLNSRMDTGYATVLRSKGIAASPEILLPQTIDGQPFLALGANYSAFASVTNATLTEGTTPNGSTEAVIGADLAQTLGVDVGDTLTLGGSLSPAITRVTVVGTYDASGIAADQLVVPLSTAHHLALRPGVVQYIRTEQTNFNDTARMPNTAASSPISVTGVSAPDITAVNQSVEVEISVKNLKARNVTHRIPITIGNTTRTRSVTLGPDAQRDLTVSIRPQAPGNQTLRVGSRTLSIDVFPPNSLRIPSELPHRAPPNATLFVPVATPTDEPVANATVSIGSRTTTTNANGIARLTLPNEPGAYTITATKGDRPQASHNLTISESAQRQLSAQLTVTPKTASVLERPKANVTVANPWNTTLSRELVLASPASSRSRNVTLGPGETAAVGVEVFSGSGGRAAPGTYTIRLLSNGSTLARTEYTIEGDDRLFSSLATTGEYSSGAGVGQAIRSVFGNIQLLFVTMVVLAGLTTVGTTTATFAQVIHARRRTIGIYRATGASPRRVLVTVLTDVCLISIPAAVVAIGLAVGATRVLESVGALTIFGIRLSTATPVPLLVATAASAFVLAVLGAVFATVPFLTHPPTGLLSDSIAKLANRYRSER